MIASENQLSLTGAASMNRLRRTRHLPVGLRQSIPSLAIFRH
jgi:hypothetical protein